MSMTSEYPQLLEIDTGDDVYEAIFTANSKYLVSGNWKGVQVWRVRDGQLVATMAVNCGAYSVAASRDGRYIAAGTTNGELFVWDTATNYRQVFANEIGADIRAIDFSPVSTRLVVTDRHRYTATIWDLAARQKVQTLVHASGVIAAKYSPRGDRIATASYRSVQVWDSNDGRLLVVVQARVVARHGLLWRNNHLFVTTKDKKIQKIDAYTGSIVSEWAAPGANSSSCIALPQHARLIACSGGETITFWDTSGVTQPRPIQCTDDICSMLFSFDGRLLAIATETNIIIKDLSSIAFRTISEPQLDIDTAILDAWKHDELTDAEALLSAAITIPENGANHVLLASRAIVRARLGHWDAALVDAKQSINVQRSLLAYMAKSMALVGKGEKDEGIRVCDTAFEHFHSEHVSLLLLIKAVVLFIAGDHVDAISRVNDLITDSAHAGVDPALYGVQACMHLLLGDNLMESNDYERAVQLFQDARIKLENRARRLPLVVTLISGWSFDNLVTTVQQRLCEALFAADRTKEAGHFLLRMMNEESNMSEPVKAWVSDFKSRCRNKLEDLGDSAVEAKQYDEAASRYTVALSLDPTNTQDLLMKRSNAWAGKGSRGGALNDAKEWARSILTSSSWKDALATAAGFVIEKFAIYQAICEHLEMTGCVTDAVACFNHMSREPAQRINSEQPDWTREFVFRCCSRLEDLGDSAMETKQYGEAISQYTAALSLDPATPEDLLVRRSRAYAQNGKWEDALNDASKVIELDSSSPSGYERKYAALLGMGHHDEATHAFETMFSKTLESADPDVRERYHYYVRPEQTKEVIRTSVKTTVRDLPLVLINTLSGRLCNKSEQAAAFESSPAFTTLVVSMITHIDHTLIEQVVGEFYRYASLSHTWEGNEPLYETVIKTVVYDLEGLPTHHKVQMFCKIVRDEGFQWAWSDTCCINKGDQFVLQEALVSMFRWYAASAMTIIFLCDVDRLAEIGALMRSLWNSRGWTLQEYHASKVVRIYTKDWTPYLGLTIYNHKESPEIISEMERATGISAESLMALRPGLNDIREKLRLASTRQTTRVEDAAYSLLGIFSMTLPATYGEGDKALGRLLSQLLTTSGDTSILAWTGTSGSFNSCLPTNIIVFSHPLTLHIPPAIPDDDMAAITSMLRASLLDLDLVTRLYDQLNALSPPSFLIQRMKLPCLAFRIRSISPFRSGSDVVFRAQAGVLGTVDIKTRLNIAQADTLYLVHPWIDFLLDRHATRDMADIAPREDDTFAFYGSPSLRSLPELASNWDAESSDDALLMSPSTDPLMDTQMKFLARLRQPFGALLLAPTRRNVEEYRRIATESEIMVQVRDITSEGTLNKLIQGVRVLDVL